MLVNISILLKFLSTLLPIFKKFIYCTVKENQQRKESFFDENKRKWIISLQCTFFSLSGQAQACSQCRLSLSVCRIFSTQDFSDWKPRAPIDNTKRRKKGNPEREREQSLCLDSPPPSDQTRRTPSTYPRTRITPSTPTSQRVALENLRQQLTFSDNEDVSITERGGMQLSYIMSFLIIYYRR